MWRCLLVFVAVGSLAGEIDLLRCGKGLETLEYGLLPNFEARFAEEFIPCSRMIEARDEAFVITIPKGHLPEWSTFPFTHIGPFPATPGRRYRLSFQGCLARGSFNALFSIFLLREGELIGGRHLFSTTMRTGGMPVVSRDFVVPPAVDEMLLWLAVSDKEPVPPGPKAVLESLTLAEVGGIPGNPAAIPLLGNDLLPAADLERQPLGAFEPAKGTFHTQNNEVEIVELDGQKCLHVVRPEGGRPYPHFMSSDAPFFGTAVEFSFEARGKGVVQPGVWWKRPVLGWNYGHAARTRLTDQWQTLTYWRVCQDPGTRQAACAMSIYSDTADFQVRNFRFRIVEAAGTDQ